MPALTPARALDLLDHIERLRAEEPRGPGWRVALEIGGRTYERHFPDREDAVDALRDAVAWRNETIRRMNAQQARLRVHSAEGHEQSLGVSVTTTSTGGTTYRVAVASLPAVGDHPRRRRVRSIDKYGYEEALRQCSEFRFEGMRERFGDAYPYASTDELLADVLDVEGVAA